MRVLLDLDKDKYEIEVQDVVDAYDDVYREEGLQVPVRKKRKAALWQGEKPGPSGPPQRPVVDGLHE